MNPNLQSPKNEYPTPLPHNKIIAKITTSAVTEKLLAVGQISKKRNHRRLWITFGAILLVTISLMAGFFAMKSVNGAVARTYTSDVKGYLNFVYDTVTTPASTPAGVSKVLATRKAPILASSILGGASSDYQVAEKLRDTATTKVEALIAKINNYAKVETFYTEYTGLHTSLEALDASGSVDIASHDKTRIVTYLQNFLDKLQAIDMLIKNTTVSSELSPYFTELSRVHIVMSTNWGGIVSAYKIGDSRAYDAASAKFSVGSRQLSNAKQPIIDYVGDLPRKTQADAREFKAYKDTVK